MISLLVSVRHAGEVAAALAGGTDVLDVKAPERGPLGMPDDETLIGVMQIHRSLCGAFGATSIPLSVALGEAAEWLTAPVRPAFAKSPDVGYLKLGTAGLVDSGRDWRTAYRDAWAVALRGSGITSASPSQRLVAVAYADHVAARAPAPEAVLEFASNEGFGGFLIDTAGKGPEGGLFSHLGVTRLAELRAGAKELGLPFALAGQLSLLDVPRLRTLAPDLVGIRSAACADNLRSGTVEPRRVAEFRAALNAS